MGAIRCYNNIWSIVSEQVLSRQSRLVILLSGIGLV